MTKLGLFVAAASVMAAASASATVLDNFNRPDAPTLGPNWTQQAGASSIVGDQATGTDLSEATFNGGSGNTVSFDVFENGGGLQYIAGVLGFGAGNEDFIKVQDNGGAQGFNFFAFYTGNNGGGLFAPLITPFTQGHVTISFSGANATLTIDPMSGPQQVYTHTYAAAPGGTGIGLGFFGPATADNFGNGGGTVPEPAAWALMLTGFALVGAAVRRRPAVRTATA